MAVSCVNPRSWLPNPYTSWLLPIETCEGLKITRFGTPHGQVQDFRPRSIFTSGYGDFHLVQFYYSKSWDITRFCEIPRGRVFIDISKTMEMNHLGAISFIREIHIAWKIRIATPRLTIATLRLDEFSFKHSKADSPTSRLAESGRRFFRILRISPRVRSSTARKVV